MKILFLDDTEYRHKSVKAKNKNHTIRHVYNSQECISALQSDAVFDLISLDFDLSFSYDRHSYRRMQNGEQNTSLEVVQFMIQNDELIRKYSNIPIVIHSLDPFGAVRMKNLLKDKFNAVIIKPNVWLINFSQVSRDDQIYE